MKPYPRIPLGTQVKLHMHRETCTVVGYNFDIYSGEFVDYILYCPAWNGEDDERGHEGRAEGNYTQQWLLGFQNRPEGEEIQELYFFAPESHLTSIPSAHVLKPAETVIRKRTRNGDRLTGCVIGYNFIKDTGDFISYIMHVEGNTQGHHGISFEKQQRFYAPYACKGIEVISSHWVYTDQLV